MNIHNIAEQDRQMPFTQIKFLLSLSQKKLIVVVSPNIMFCCFSCFHVLCTNKRKNPHSRPIYLQVFLTCYFTGTFFSSV
ncbi:hypothetical protein ACJX0J_031515, partial [Zea mays]